MLLSSSHLDLEPRKEAPTRLITSLDDTPLNVTTMKASFTILSLAALNAAGVITAAPIGPARAHTTQVASYDSGYDESGESIPAHPRHLA